MEFTRINNDTNGNPRKVIHFLDLNTETEKNDSSIPISEKYRLAVKRAHKLGGRKYNAKAYGGGIVFQSYNDADLQKSIEETILADEK